MVKNIYSFYDVVSKTYSPPMVMLNNGEALRYFADVVNDKSYGNLSKHPGDFMLFEIGRWDDCSGVVEPLMPPNRLAIGTDFVLDKAVLQ